jgi:hypothetical protein
MSHIIQVKAGVKNMVALFRGCARAVTKDGQPALEMAFMDGCQLDADGQLCRDGRLVTKGDVHYRGWKDDHGRLAGDWNLPAGVTEAQAGDNAVAVIRLTEAAKAEVKAKSRYQEPAPYEIGVIPVVDAEGRVSYDLAHDFYMGGHGVEDYVGKTEADYGTQQAKNAYGDLMQYYQIACAQLAAEEMGHDCEVEKQPDGSYLVVTDRQGVGVTA